MNFEEIFKACSPRSKKGLKEVLKNWGDKKIKIREYYLNTIKAAESSHKTTCPGRNDLSKGTGEKKYQRDFLIASVFDCEPTQIRGEKIKVTWCDYELPVVKTLASRKLPLDLIGIDQDKKFVIAEIKDTGGTSPFDAIRELLVYAFSMEKNNTDKRITEKYGKLNFHKGFLMGSKEKENKKYELLQKMEKIEYLVMAAPEGYWEKTKGGKEGWGDYSDRLKEIKEWVEEKYKYKLIFTKFKVEQSKPSLVWEQAL